MAALYVHPDAQGRGIGTAMLSRLVDDLTARGYAPILLGHFVGNDRAARMYRRFGSQADGARRPVPGLGIDEVRLRLAQRVG